MPSPLFLIDLTYIRPLEEVDTHRDAHMAYVKAYYETGNFFASGPKSPRTGGMILAHGKNRDEIERIVEEDPFYQEKVAEFTITEFSTVKFPDNLKDILGD